MFYNEKFPVVSFLFKFLLNLKPDVDLIVSFSWTHKKTRKYLTYHIKLIICAVHVVDSLRKWYNETTGTRHGHILGFTTCSARTMHLFVCFKVVQKRCESRINSKSNIFKLYIWLGMNDLVIKCDPHIFNIRNICKLFRLFHN